MQEGSFKFSGGPIRSTVNSQVLPNVEDSALSDGPFQILPFQIDTIGSLIFLFGPLSHLAMLNAGLRFAEPLRPFEEYKKKACLWLPKRHVDNSKLMISWSVKAMLPS